MYLGLRFWCVFRLADRVFCSAEKAKLEETHAAALKTEQDKVATLTKQLADLAEARKVETEQAATEKTRLVEEVKQLRQAAEASEGKVKLAEEAAQRFQTRIDSLAAEFKKVQAHMHGKTNFRETHPFDVSELSFFLRTLF